MTTLLEAARAVLTPCDCDDTCSCESAKEDALRAAIAAAEQAPAVVAAEEMRALLNERGWTVPALDRIAALVAERTAATVEAAVAREREACARVADEWFAAYPTDIFPADSTTLDGKAAAHGRNVASNIAAEIRARTPATLHESALAEVARLVAGAAPAEAVTSLHALCDEVRTRLESAEAQGRWPVGCGLSQALAMLRKEHADRRRT